jgi:hypothetical protein
MGFKVGDEYRKNDLSLVPGGSEVKTVSRNGKSKIYDKIKNIASYCDRLKKDAEIFEIWVDGSIYWIRNT